MDQFILGTSAFANADPALIRSAGISWIRHDFPFPFSDRIGGTLDANYIKAKEGGHCRPIAVHLERSPARIHGQTEYDGIFKQLPENLRFSSR
jgi:hypothetical protein